MIEAFRPLISHIFLKEVDSTNRYASEHFESLPDFTLVSAARQTGGRGRSGKTWISTGENFYGSLIIKDMRFHPHTCGRILSLACLELLRHYAPSSRFWIKWPNDIFSGDKKICGILCEIKTDITNNPCGLVAGFGINVNSGADEMSGIDNPASSVYIESGHLSDIKKFSFDAGNFFSEMYCNAFASGTDWIFSRWKEENLLAGRDVKLVTEQGLAVEGRVIDILPGGQLLFRPDGGEDTVLNSGTVSIKSAEGLFEKKI